LHLPFQQSFFHAPVRLTLLPGIRHALRLKETETHHCQLRGQLFHKSPSIIRSKVEQIVCHGFFTTADDRQQQSSWDIMVNYTAVFTQQLRRRRNRPAAIRAAKINLDDMRGIGRLKGRIDARQAIDITA
jgi:hypothetical protein